MGSKEIKKKVTCVPEHEYQAISPLSSGPLVDSGTSSVKPSVPSLFRLAADAAREAAKFAHDVAANFACTSADEADVDAVVDAGALAVVAVAIRAVGCALAVFSLNTTDIDVSAAIAAADAVDAIPIKVSSNATPRKIEFYRIVADFARDAAGFARANAASADTALRFPLDDYAVYRAAARVAAADDVANAAADVTGAAAAIADAAAVVPDAEPVVTDCAPTGALPTVLLNATGV